MDRTTAYVGQNVSFTNKGIRTLGKIEKKNPKNFQVRTTNGLLWNVPPALLTPVTDEVVKIAGANEYTLGSVVEYRRGGVPAGHYVIIKIDSNMTYRIAKLGGDRGRVIRGVGQDALTPVKIEVEA